MAKNWFILRMFVRTAVMLLLMSLSAQAQSVRKFQEIADRLDSLHQPMGPIKPGDWLESHNEPGQTFRQYVKSRPVKLTRNRKFLYVLPLGPFDATQMKIVERSAEFLGIYFGCPVKTMSPIGLDKIPAKARRVHPSWGVRQIKSTYVLSDVLYPRLPNDAVAMISLTTSDLYPDEEWNFVFGQASLKNRVGVWSMFRNGDPQSEYQTCLRRTLQTATHETGHMFSIKHCIAHECNMCGSNSRQESDRRPLYLCPECLPKVWWATKVKPEKRFENLIQFCLRNELSEEATYYQRALKAISQKSENDSG